MNFDPVQVLADRFALALAGAFPEHANADPLIAPARNPKFGDFQSNVAMSLSKQVDMPPRDVAMRIVEALELNDIAEPLTQQSIAGPGFINIRLKPDAIAALLANLDTEHLGIDPPSQPRTIVVDLAGVNLAKQMHVGHLRSIVIGDALARVFHRLGDTVVRQNHVGDWGLPIAMVTAKLKSKVDTGELALDSLSLDDLNALYREAQTECAADTKGLAAARKWWSHPKAIAELEDQVAGALEHLEGAKQTLLLLQAHDPEVVRIWERIAQVTLAECISICARLHADVTAEASAGESSYAEELALIVDDLVRRGIAEESDGALVVRCQGIEEPTLIRKSDGGFLYATTDLAGIRRRIGKLGADRAVYAVDARQSLHFKQVFAAAKKAGYTTKPDGSLASLEHAAFGTVLGEDHRPFKTRSGENIKLADLLDESVERALQQVREKNPDLPEDEQQQVAEAVGIAAIKYMDLSSDRVKDYVFSFDRMLAFEGNTGPYLLYAVVRMRSIFRNAIERLGDDVLAKSDAAPLQIHEPEEKQLALTLLRYPNTVLAVADTLEPHRLCQYLYDLAQTFSGFFQNVPVLKGDDDSTRLARLRLCKLTERIMTDGLGLLGIPTLDRM